MPTAQENLEYYRRNNQDNERVIDVISIAHSLLSQTFYMCQEPTGHTVTLETAAVVVAEGRNFNYKRSSSKGDLDERYQITFDDTEGQLQSEADLIPLDDDEDIVITARSYLLSDLTSIAEGPVTLNAISLTFKAGVAAIEAQSESMTQNRTGESSTYERFPMQS